MFPRSILVCMCLLLLLITTSGCTSHTGNTAVPAQPAVNATAVQKVEVIHFHGNRQCVSCIAVGDLAEKTVNTNFGKELASGRLVFAHVKYDEPENASLAEKYGVTGSSLWIGVYDAGGFHREQDLRVWSLINDKELYETYLSGVIAKRLNGDLS